MRALRQPLEEPRVEMSFSPDLSALYSANGGPSSGSGTTVRYSIRVPNPPTAVACPRCKRPFRAAGPTGFANSHPICDRCLLENAHELGMLIALMAVTRTFGAISPQSREESREALLELGAFARIYEKVASRSGPVRLFPLGDA